MTGYTAQSWKTAPVFSGRIATQDDVTSGAAVFAMGDTLEGKVGSAPLPQPALWYEDDDEAADEAEAEEPRAVLIVQAETHETESGLLEVLGLMMPDGTTAVGFAEDVDLAEPGDAFWEGLVEEALFGGGA